MSAVTTHILDTARGRPAGGVPVTLELAAAGGAWQVVGQGSTDDDGRLRTLLAGGRPAAGVYRITFDTATYFEAIGVDAFYPAVQVIFRLADPAQHYHVPLLLSPFGFSTYRGS